MMTERLVLKDKSANMPAFLIVAALKRMFLPHHLLPNRFTTSTV